MPGRRGKRIEDGATSFEEKAVTAFLDGEVVEPGVFNTVTLGRAKAVRLSAASAKVMAEDILKSLSKHTDDAIRMAKYIKRALMEMRHGHPRDPVSKTEGFMGRRDKFAAMAMHALLMKEGSDPMAWKDVASYERLSRNAYKFADAMMYESERRDGE